MPPKAKTPNTTPPEAEREAQDSAPGSTDAGGAQASDPDDQQPSLPTGTDAGEPVAPPPAADEAVAATLDTVAAVGALSGDLNRTVDALVAKAFAVDAVDDDTAATYAAVGALTGETDEEVAAQVALADRDPERVQVAAVAGIASADLFAWKWYDDRLVVVAVDGQKRTVPR
ncbi:hypothetical protein [Plasticicumulans sp.]|uniref:hypothetical protein n=1 Tax=Plasticicumulans sp. TaxID=2307179 RepID=UPI0032208C69